MVIALALAVSLGAAEFTPIPYRERKVAGWSIGQPSSGDSCIMSMEYEGEGSSELSVSLDPDGSNFLLLTNYGWSIKDGEKYYLDFFLSGGGYENHMALGSISGSRKGFGTTFETKFLDYFASSSFFRVKRGDVTVDSLKLQGSSAAVAELRRCIAVVKANMAGEARDKARFKNITKDPFANQ